MPVSIGDGEYPFLVTDTVRRSQPLTTETRGRFAHQPVHDSKNTIRSTLRDRTPRMHWCLPMLHQESQTILNVSLPFKNQIK